MPNAWPTKKFSPYPSIYDSREYTIESELVWLGMLDREVNGFSFNILSTISEKRSVRESHKAYVASIHHLAWLAQIGEKVQALRNILKSMFLEPFYERSCVAWPTDWKKIKTFKTFAKRYKKKSLYNPLCR